MTGELTDAPSTIYDMLTDADMRFPTITDADGQAVELTQGRYRGMISSKDRRVRRESFEAMMGTYAKYGNTFAATYAASVKSDVFEARARRFDGALQASLHPDEVPVAVYDHLIDAIHAAIPTLQRYINLRKPILGLDEVHLYDLYVNMVQDFDLPLTYPEAFDLVLEALAPLGEEYVDKLREARAQGWVDVYESEGKSSGAYSWGVYGVHPFVLLNFEKGIDAASTLAHELGHAMHSDYSNGAQAFPQAEYSLFAAEVASTVNEILLSCHLLRKYPDKAAQAYVMGELMEGFRTTVFRQTLFAEFERESHAMAERGEALTREALSARYLEINRQYYGGCCVMDDAICQEWMRIPHFYRAFYVYKYATGFSAAVTIARRILREGAPAVADYQRFLRAGKSLPPMEALRLAGVDMATEKPVRDAMDWFAQIVEQFEALMQ
ncbi:MAG: oligoendopeptidase F, partial [Clostridia bacterium]